MKKIIAVVKVQNDGDIIESLCRYYCSFCDGILVIDDMSSDDTPYILKSLVDEGLPVFIPDINKFPFGKVSRRRLFNMAINHYNADLILPIDADEFLINVNGGNPRSVLELLDETVEYHIFRRNYICPKEIKNNMFFSMNTDKYTELLSPKAIAHCFLFKEKKAYPTTGGHFFNYTINPPETENIMTLCYNHYPVRNTYQFMLKIILGWVNYLTYPYHDGDRHYGMAWHWKTFYEEIKKHGIITREMLERFSVYSSTSIPDDNNYPLMEKSFDTSFCNDKIKLRYTNYDKEKDYFIPILTTQLETNLLRMPSWRSIQERKVAGEQLGQANAVIHNLNAYIETLQKYPSQNQTGTFYFDTGKGFSEEEKTNFQLNNETNNFYYKVLLSHNAQYVRFDPVEGCGCFLQNLVIKSDTGKILEYSILNGIKSEGNGIIFTTTDPQILIVVNEAKEIEVLCNIWFLT
jgi:glycosyltransferase involved in cell wall biosynthesis